MIRIIERRIEELDNEIKNINKILGTRFESETNGINDSNNDILHGLDINELKGAFFFFQMLLINGKLKYVDVDTDKFDLYENVLRKLNIFDKAKSVKNYIELLKNGNDYVFLTLADENVLNKQIEFIIEIKRVLRDTIHKISTNERSNNLLKVSEITRNKSLNEFIKEYKELLELKERYLKKQTTLEDYSRIRELASNYVKTDNKPYELVKSFFKFSEEYNKKI